MKGKKILYYIKWVGAVAVGALLLYIGYNAATFLRVPTKSEVDSKANGSTKISDSDLSWLELTKLYVDSLNVFKRL